MILAVLPIAHFFFGFLTVAWRRGARFFLILSGAIDAALFGHLCVRTNSGDMLSVVLGGWQTGIGIRLTFDRTALAFVLLAIVLEIAVICFLWRAKERPYFYMLLHLLFGSVYALVLSNDLFNIYVILELLTLVSFLLVGYERKAIQIWASLKYLILASTGMGIFLLGVAVTYFHVGSLDLGRIAAPASLPGASSWTMLAGALLAAGVAVKAGIFSSSLWLPTAHAVAPPAISALLSGLVIKMGVVVLLRLSRVFSLALPMQILGGLTGVFGAVYAFRTYDIKRMLAFHTLSQIGYLILGIGIGSPEATAGVLAYAVAHGLFKGLLFLAAGSASRTVGASDLRTLIAQRVEIPLSTKAALLVGTLGITAVPPFAGFVAKGFLVSAAHNPGIQVTLLLISLGTAASFAKLLPLFRFSRAPGARSSDCLAFAVLALPIACFYPISKILFSNAGGHGLFGWLHVAETLGAIAAGLALHLALRNRPIPLPKRIFHLEEALLLVLIGFLVVFFLIQLS